MLALLLFGRSISDHDRRSARPHGIFLSNGKPVVSAESRPQSKGWSQVRKSPSQDAAVRQTLGERVAAARRFDYGPNAFVQRRETSVQSSLRESSSRNSGRSKVADGSPQRSSSSRPSATLSFSISPVEEAAIDRLKLETVYLRALDALMSAVDEYQLQAAILRLRRAQARLHGSEMQGSPRS